MAQKYRRKKISGKRSLIDGIDPCVNHKKINGELVTYYDDNTIASITHYVNGIKEGKHYEYDQGCLKINESNYKNNRLHGLCIKYLTLTTEYTRCDVFCYYIDGSRNGKYMEYIYCKLGKYMDAYVYYINNTIWPNISGIEIIKLSMIIRKAQYKYRYVKTINRVQNYFSLYAHGKDIVNLMFSYLAKNEYDSVIKFIYNSM